MGNNQYATHPAGISHVRIPIADRRLLQSGQFTKAIPAETFIKEYAQQRYGLSEDEAQTFLNYFLLPQELVRHGKDAKGKPIEQVIQECEELKSNFNKIVPRKLGGEFEHYRLMLDLRINYLQYKEVEFTYESSRYDVSQASGLATQLKKIIGEAGKLDKRFIKLNKELSKTRTSGRDQRH